MTQEKYSENYYSKNKHNNLSDFKKLFLEINDIIPMFSNYYYNLYKIIKNIPHNGKILDVGVAKGTFSTFIQNIRPDVKIYGLDFTDVSKLLPKNINFIQDNATKFELSEKFDLIVCNHLLEHIDINKVPNVLNQINKHLKKNGIFWLTVPSFSKSFFNDPTHIRPYNKISVDTLAKITNFKNCDIFEGNYFRFPFYFFKWKLKITYGVLRK